MAEKQLVAILGFLAFAGTILALALALTSTAIVRLAGQKRLARRLALGVLLIVGGYGTTLLAASMASTDRLLSTSEEKYFCEIDCHLAYSVARVERTSILAASPLEDPIGHQFYVVSLRTRFDEHTISPHRGDAPLAPSPRVLSVIDDHGRSYSLSARGQQALENLLGARWTPLTAPLRPGESYVTQLVFDIPPGASGLKLLVASPSSPAWLDRLVIGAEESIFHKKVYLRLPG